MPDMRALRELSAKLQPIINEMTAPDSLRSMTAGTHYLRSVAAQPGCSVYASLGGHYDYMLGLEIPNSLGLDERDFELLVLVAAPDKLVPADLMRRRHPSEPFCQVRFWNIPICMATDTLPQLEAF